MQKSTKQNDRTKQDLRNNNKKVLSSKTNYSYTLYRSFNTSNNSAKG
jgi:hypothetical protein